MSNNRNQDRKFTDPIKMVLAEEAVVSGRVLSPDEKPAAGMEVIARLSGRGQSSYLSSFRAVTDEAGRFFVHGLPETELELSVVDPKKTWAFWPLSSLLVSPNKDPDMTLKMEHGVLVSGMVHDPEGKPVEGAAIWAITEVSGLGLVEGMTKEDGRYQLRLPAGAAHLYFNSLPPGFAFPGPQIFKRLEIDAGRKTSMTSM